VDEHVSLVQPVNIKTEKVHFYVVVPTFGQESRNKILNRLLLQVAF